MRVSARVRVPTVIPPITGWWYDTRFAARRQDAYMLHEAAQSVIA